jgi:hypothetical protein
MALLGSGRENNRIQRRVQRNNKVLETVVSTRSVLRGINGISLEFGAQTTDPSSRRRQTGRLTVSRNVTLTLILFSVAMGYLPDSNDVSTEAEESPLLRSVTGKRLV